jgi:hypothetical protein
MKGGCLSGNYASLNKERHYHCILLLFANVSRVKIAEILGVRPSTVDDWVEDEEFRKARQWYANSWHLSCRVDIEGLFVLAISKLRDHLLSETRSISLRAAEIIFRLAGFYNRDPKDVVAAEEERQDRMLGDDPFTRLKSTLTRLERDLDLPTKKLVDHVQSEEEMVAEAKAFEATRKKETRDGVETS